MNKSSRKMVIVAGIIIVLASALYSCGGGGGGSMTTTPPPDSTVQLVACPASGTTDVSIVSQVAPGFSPSNLTVPVNTMVKWTNNDTIQHTVTSTTVPANGAFDSSLINPGTSVCFKFTSAGTFNYHCSIHPATMIGVVTVQ